MAGYHSLKAACCFLMALKRGVVLDVGRWFEKLSIDQD